MKIIIAIVVVILAVVGFWTWRYPSGHWRYRMTVTVETPEGIKTGSAVREVQAYREPEIFPQQPGGHASIRGEAIAVDLGERGILFGLYEQPDNPDYSYQIMLDMFPMPDEKYGGGGLTVKGINYYSHLQTGKADLPISKLPLLVRFRDIRDPKTVEQVDPRNLTASFGEGVRLGTVTIEPTDDPVTTGIEKRLPWFKEFHNKHFDGERFETIKAKNRLANSLSSEAFSTGASHYDKH